MGSTVASLKERLVESDFGHWIDYNEIEIDTEAILKVVEEWIYDVDEHAQTSRASLLFASLVGNL